MTLMTIREPGPSHDHAHSVQKVNMHSNLPRTLQSFAAAMLLLMLSACSTVERRQTQPQYDLGYPAARAAAATPARSSLVPVSVSEISAPSWMDSTRMYYRLDYDDPLEAHTYAQARWTMAPSRLFLQRLKARVSEAGGGVLGGGDGAVGVPRLRIEADDFSQVFSAPKVSTARVAMRVSVLKERKLVAQRTFTASAPAPTPDAAGGVHALALASDAMIADMIAWLSTLPLTR